MAQNLFDKCREDFFLLLEAGFIAVNNADEDSALKLFTAAQSLRPESTFPKVGHGYLHMCKLELKQATEMFNKVLDQEPTNEMAKTLLGISLSMTPSKVAEGEKILTEECNNTLDKDLKELANTALGFVDRFVKKGAKASPMDLHAKKKPNPKRK